MAGMAYLEVGTEGELVAALESGNEISLVNSISLSDTLTLSEVSDVVISGQGFTLDCGWDGELDDDDFEHYYQYSNTGIRCFSISDSVNIVIRDLKITNGFAGAVSRNVLIHTIIGLIIFFHDEMFVPRMAAPASTLLGLPSRSSTVP